MELRAYDVVVTLSVGKSRNYQKLRIRYVTVTSCVSWGVCQKTVGNSAGDFHGGGERKTPTSWIRTAIKSPTTPCIW